MRTIFLAFSLLTGTFSFAQNAEQSLAAAMKKMETDAQFKHASISLYVVDSKTGKVVFDKNSELGLAPASTLKVVTSAAAFELLGQNYRYKTDVGYDGHISKNTLNGNLFFTGSGDPTLGSWRWKSTAMDSVQAQILAALKANNITSITGDIIIDESKWTTQATPRGWTWDDIGNYYGAGARPLNWHENQYDLILKPGKNTGDPVEVVRTEPELPGSVLINELKTGKPGSGDNAIIYLPENGETGFVRGTVEGSGKTFTISGAMPNAAFSFYKATASILLKNGIDYSGKSKSSVYYFLEKEKMPAPANIFLSFNSPTFDSINYYFLQRSVNLFGEAFVKTIAFEKTGFGSTEAGIDVIREFWSKRNIEPSALNMIDGSGLSPANRVTTNALVTVMQYARQQNWFASFYHGLPLQNGIKMKSGSIGGVRSYTGYIKTKAGTEYSFAFIINNFSGSAGSVREKMWKLLDILK